MYAVQLSFFQTNTTKITKNQIHGMVFQSFYFTIASLQNEFTVYAYSSLKPINQIQKQSSLKAIFGQKCLHHQGRRHTVIIELFVVLRQKTKHAKRDSPISTVVYTLDQLGAKQTQNKNSHYHKTFSPSFWVWRERKRKETKSFGRERQGKHTHRICHNSQSLTTSQPVNPNKKNFAN